MENEATMTPFMYYLEFVISLLEVLLCLCCLSLCDFIILWFLACAGELFFFVFTLLVAAILVLFRVTLLCFVLLRVLCLSLFRAVWVRLACIAFLCCVLGCVALVVFALFVSVSLCFVFFGVCFRYLFLCTNPLFTTKSTQIIADELRMPHFFGGGGGYLGLGNLEKLALEARI